MVTFAREKALLNRSNMAIYLMAATICFLTTLAAVYPSIKATGLMYEYSSKVRELEALKELNKKLALETAALRTYGVIEQRAMTKFGFVFPDPDQVVIIAKK